MHSRSKPIVLFFGLLAVSANSYGVLTLSEAEQRALASDNGIRELKASAAESRSLAGSAGQLPDPKLIVGLLNVPTDSFRFDQEPMTQFKVGVQQQFLPGSTLSLKERKMNEMAEGAEFSAVGRKLGVLKEVREIWLEAQYWAQESRILAQDETLFRQLLEVTHSLYSVGKVQQKDVLRAELELGRLHDRRIRARRMGEMERSKLSRWVGQEAFTEALPEQLPVMVRPSALSATTSSAKTSSAVHEALKRHPMLAMLSQKSTVASTQVQLEEQKYQPMWGVELSYGYRDGKNANGSDRTDFFSAMVNVSLPLFTPLRQDRSVQAAKAAVDAARYQWEDQYQQFRANIAMLRDKLAQVDDQLTLYDEEILTKADLQAQAALNAYQADAADFAEVMRAYLSEQKDRLAYERLKVTRLQTLSALHFFLPETDVLQADLPNESHTRERNP